MTTTGEKSCREEAESGQLVVDTTHLPAVQEMLGTFDVLGIEVGAVPEFDLTLIRLVHSDSDSMKPVSDPDPVLTELRARCAGRCGGWTPLIGKNRPMSSVFGAYPQTKSHTIWNPEKATRPSGAFEADAGRNVRVGLLDTKIFDHPDLVGVEPVDHQKFSSPEKLVFNFEEGHGTFMAGLILQQAPKARLVARATLGADGKAPAWCVVKKLAEFLQDKPEDRVHLLVLASGCRTYDGKAPLILERAIERLNRERITVVAAAGNHGALLGMSTDTHATRNSPTWPAALPGVVAAGTPEPPPGVDSKYDYSPKLPWVTCTVAPDPSGTFVSTYLSSNFIEMYEGSPATNLTTGYVSWRGTSCAAAFLGGAIAAQMPHHEMDARKALAALGDKVKKFDWKY